MVRLVVAEECIAGMLPIRDAAVLELGVLFRILGGVRSLRIGPLLWLLRGEGDRHAENPHLSRVGQVVGDSTSAFSTELCKADILALEHVYGALALLDTWKVFVTLER